MMLVNEIDDKDEKFLNRLHLVSIVFICALPELLNWKANDSIILWTKAEYSSCRSGKKKLYGLTLLTVPMFTNAPDEVTIFIMYLQ